MTKMTILEIVNEMLESLGLAALKTLCNSDGALERQLLAIMNAQGRMLTRCTRWGGLTRTHVFKTVRGKTQPGGMPDDYLDMVKDDRFPRIFKIQYDSFRAVEDMIEDKTISYDYISKNWVLDTDGTTGKMRIKADTDTVRYDDQLFLLALKYHFLEEKGLDYVSTKVSFSRMLDHLVGQNNGCRRISY